ESVPSAHGTEREGRRSTDSKPCKRSQRRYQTAKKAAAADNKRFIRGGDCYQTSDPAGSANRNRPCKFAVIPRRMEMAELHQRMLPWLVRDARGTQREQPYRTNHASICRDAALPPRRCRP